MADIIQLAKSKLRAIVHDGPKKDEANDDSAVPEKKSL